MAFAKLLLTRDVELAWPYPGQEVYVTGSFSDWTTTYRLSSANPKSTKTVKLKLQPGTYQYKFIVDGQWCYDVLKDSCCDDKLNRNNKLEVPPPDLSEQSDYLVQYRKGISSALLKKDDKKAGVQPILRTPLMFPYEVISLIGGHLDVITRHNFYKSSYELYIIHLKYCIPLQTPTLLCYARYGFLIFQLKHMEGAERSFSKEDQFEVIIQPTRGDQGRSLFLEISHTDRMDLRNNSFYSYKGDFVKVGLIATNKFGSKYVPGYLNCPNEHLAQYVRVPAPHYYCWNGTAQIHMYDGTTKNVEDVEVGDVLLGASGSPTTVKRIKRTAINDNYKVVDMGDFYITRGHPIWYQNEWYRPDEVYPLSETYIEVLYNFYAEPEHFLVIGKERVVCSSLGGYCPRLAEMDPFTDVLYGRGYGSYEAEHYKWLLSLKERIPDHEVHPKIPTHYEDLFPGREHIVIIGK